MMRTILVPLTAGLEGEPVLDAALALARRLNGHIRALFILPDPHAVLAFLPDVILAAGVTREVIERERQEAAGEKNALSTGEAATEALLLKSIEPEELTVACDSAIHMA